MPPRTRPLEPPTIPKCSVLLPTIHVSNGLDFATIHELSHQWWGGMAYGARMRGRQMLNESLAQYSTLMIFKEYFGRGIRRASR